MTNDEPPEGESEPTQHRLDALQDQIDRAREGTGDIGGESDTPMPETETDREFVESGTEGPVDDTIAPPG